MLLMQSRGSFDCESTRNQPHSRPMPGGLCQASLWPGPPPSCVRHTDMGGAGPTLLFIVLCAQAQGAQGRCFPYCAQAYSSSFACSRTHAKNAGPTGRAFFISLLFCAVDGLTAFGVKVPGKSLVAAAAKRAKSCAAKCQLPFALPLGASSRRSFLPLTKTERIPQCALFSFTAKTAQKPSGYAHVFACHVLRAGISLRLCSCRLSGCLTNRAVKGIEPGSFHCRAPCPLPEKYEKLAFALRALHGCAGPPFSHTGRAL